MEIKKNKKSEKSFYIPVLVVLIVVAAIVAISTSVREAKESERRAAKSASDNIPVVATPATEDKNEDNVPPYKKDRESELEAALTPPETKETEAPETEQTVLAPAVPTFIAPTGGTVSKTFSDTVPVFSSTMNDYRVHTGVDVTGEPGEAVLASCGGTVGAIWDDPLMGKCMTVVHDGGFVSTYKGLYEVIPDGIAQGVAVSAGQPIAALGESALIEVAEEPHVHFELSLNGVPVDPTEYVAFAAAPNYGE